MNREYLKSISQKYKKYVIKQKGCWDWSGCKINGGYGSFRVGYPKIYAHRASWMIHNKQEIPKGLCVLHKCDNPSCTNPKHLFLGTQKDNNLDAIAKKRHPTFGKLGEENHRSKLKKEHILLIRKLAAEGLCQKEIAKRFDISYSHVSTIVQNTCWSWL